jgi:OOP family OmpA-OmpF porin
MSRAALRLVRCGIAALIAAAPPALAKTVLPLPPEARQTLRQVTVYDTHALPVGPWSSGRLPVIELRGTIEEVAWRIPGTGHNTLKLAEDLAAALKQQGYLPIFACESDGCGGFDFRYEAPILPEPQMHVDLGNFRYIALVRGTGAAADYASLLVSRAGDIGFVQMTRIGGAGKVPLPELAPEPPPDPAEAPASPGAGDSLDTTGRLVLEDLAFASGAAELGAGPFASLGEVAAFLAANPDRTVAIVGHTDASGSLAANIAVSKRRAQSVVERLIGDYGADPGQLTAEGVGYLVPRATNLTEAGRQKNRRVEAVLTSTR